MYQQIQFKNSLLWVSTAFLQVYILMGCVEKGLVQASFIIYPDHDLRILGANSLNYIKIIQKL